MVVEEEQFKRWEYFSLSVSGTATALFGVYGEFSLGYIPADGLFIQGTLGQTIGFDISSSINLTTGDYIGDVKPTGYTLQGKNMGYSLGVAAWSLGESYDVFGTNPVQSKYSNVVRYENHHFGENWKMNTQGISLGSKTLFGGHMRETKTSAPLYLYKHK